ncbi:MULTISPECIES: SDR family NAD(P)-dependent oxidoreductase [Salinibaculum]|uniref:SDR family NAD(P)-dependent oxidoreductase n=1 Tax=Salinibaculum TaxID=2732368 RepID=UPI00361E462F
MMLVQDKVAVITGAASGIGESTALRYAEEGAKVVAADVDVEAGQATVDEIEDDGGEATFVETNVAEEDDVKEMIETAVSEYGGIDVLFNNAGIEGPLSTFADYDMDSFDQVVAVNLRGVFMGIKYGIEAMLADGGGSIISTSSIAADSGVMGRSAYSATKAGVNGMTRVAAMEYAEDDIRVNTVLPGIVETPMHHRAAEQKPDRVTRFEVSEAMQGKGQPERLADAVLFLGSDLSARITGVTLPVDGGFLIKP